MSDLERAKLIPVSGNNNTPDMDNAVDVQFNPVTLKVNLSNTLKANPNQGNSRATQFVDKSSSTLTVELVFDTTYIEAPTSQSQDGDSAGSGSNRNQIEQGSDVRMQTRKIADKFIKAVESGKKMLAPSRVLFQWGSFEFIGMVQSFDETLDFFSPKGRPLRATVSLKLSEDRYQFRSNDNEKRAMEQIPELVFTGNGAGAGEPGGGSGAGNGATAPNQNVSPVPGGSGGSGSWRDNAMFNGIESPRLPSVSALALPSVSLQGGAGFGISGGAAIGLSAGISAGGGLSAGVSAGAGAARKGGSAGGGEAWPQSGITSTIPPAFKYGNSPALGTGVPGAFHPNPNTSLKASSLQHGSQQLRAEFATPEASGTVRPGAGRAKAPRASGERSTRNRPRVSVANLLKSAPDSGVGFD